MKGQSQPPLVFLLPLLVFPPEEQFSGCVLRIPRVLQKDLPEPTHLQTQQPCLYILHVGFHLKFHFEKGFYCLNMEEHCSRFAQVWSNCYNTGQPLMKGWYQHWSWYGIKTIASGNKGPQSEMQVLRLLAKRKESESLRVITFSGHFFVHSCFRVINSCFNVSICSSQTPKFSRFKTKYPHGSSSDPTCHGYEYLVGLKMSPDVAYERLAQWFKEQNHMGQKSYKP